MKINPNCPLLFGIFLFLFSVTVNAQNQSISQENSRNVIIVGAKKTVAVSGKVAYVVVKETANVAWETTRFTAKEVAAPIAKTILVKAPPKIAKFALKKSAPVSKKLIVSYLKYKLPF